MSWGEGVAGRVGGGVGWGRAGEAYKQKNATCIYGQTLVVVGLGAAPAWGGPPLACEGEDRGVQM